MYISRLYALDDLDELTDEPRAYVGGGVTRLKQCSCFGPEVGPPGMGRNIELVKVIREAVGPEVVPSAGACVGGDLGYTVEISKRLREFELGWIEVPLKPGLVERYAQLHQRLLWHQGPRGEHSYRIWDFSERIRMRATDVSQPDINRAVGLTEGRGIAALRETRGTPLVPHSNGAHNLALVFSRSPHVPPMVEYFQNGERDRGNELFGQFFNGNSIATDGMLTYQLTRPEIGVTLCEDNLASRLVRDGRLVTWIT